jgi:hypothetical protein
MNGDLAKDMKMKDALPNESLSIYRSVATRL